MVCKSSLASTAEATIAIHPYYLMGFRLMWLEWSWYLGSSKHSPIGTIIDFTIELC